MKAIATSWVATAVGSSVLAAALTGIPMARADSPSGSDGGAPGGITLRASMKAYTGYEGHLLNSGFDNNANPGNQVLNLPTSTWLEDLRPVFKMESDAGISAVVKPWLLITGNWVNSQYGQSIDFEWIEAYAKWQLNENMTVSAGTQNVQWGPGELFSPSNEIFPFFLQNGTPLFYLRGRQLFDATWTPSRNSSVILLAEYARNGDPVFQAGTPFAKKALLKGETTFTTGDGANAHTISLIAGTDENRANWLGQYANFTVSDALSLYVDASENFSKTAFYPNTAVVPGSVELAGPEGSQNGFFPRVLAGGRYSFPKSVELRLEYFYNGLGWTGAQYAAALTTFNDPTYGTQNLARFLQPGLDFRGQHYVYASLRIGDLGHQDKLTYFFRYLQNLTDDSSSAIVSVEWTPADRWALLGAVLAELGPPNTELTQIESGEAQAALRLNF